jgi:hypothetical protein|tara:strand:+ start:864 stop:1049 length:186 start_codon:yes stop_codon:yes gene_type:complete
MSFYPPRSHVIAVAEVRKKIIESKNKTEVIKVLLEWASQNGINSDTAPDDEWWKKRERLGV